MSQASVARVGESQSFAWCSALTRRTARNFKFAFRVLPRPKRRAMDALYAFMRITDDLADANGDAATKRVALRDWRSRLREALAGDYSHPLHPALHRTVDRFAIPDRYLHAVIDGVSTDIEPVRFGVFDDLYRYCYRVASTVGLCCIRIWGFRGPEAEAERLAEAAGIALQLTNILRDLGEDLELDRVYLPEEDWQRFGCPPETWPSAAATRSFREMMHFQVCRARSYYSQAEGIAPLLDDSSRAVFRVMTEIYRGLLDTIERNDYDVFSRRIRIPGWRKASILLRAFPIRWGWM